MNNVFNGRFIFVLVITAICILLTVPTARYFVFVNGLGETLTAEQEVQKRAFLDNPRVIKLGLDLQGGVDFLIEVDTDKMRENKLKGLMEALRAEFERERVSAVVRYVEDAAVLTVALDDAIDVNIAREVIEEYSGMLAPDDLGKLDGGTVTLSMRGDVLEAERKSAVEAALKTVRRRIDEFGLTQPVVVLQPPNRIRVQIPGETNPDRIRNGLLRTAHLEFRMVHEDMARQVTPFIKPGTAFFNTGVIKDEFLETIPSPDGVGEITRLKADIPGVPAGYQLFLGEDVKIANDGTRTVTSNLVYLLKDRPELTGEQLRRASVITDINAIGKSPYQVTLEFDTEGTEKFAEVTTDNTGRQFAIVLDGLVHSAPSIDEPILFGRCQISGTFTQQEAQDLSLTLKAGALPAPLRVIEQNTIGASLGRDSIVDSTRSLVIGTILLAALMIFIYRTAGFFAILAMMLNASMILAILSLMGATLTLSGVGGVLLTMGMALDANVLIYERLREELNNGKPIRAAINTAFERAFSVILDSNITSLLPALVLVLFEIVEGSVKGFWIALTIGLIANVYTGMTVTRALIEAWVAKYKTISVGKFEPFKGLSVDWMKAGTPALTVSGLLFVASIGWMAAFGLNLGVDFTGGVTATVEYRDESVSRAGIEEVLEKNFGGDAQVVKIVNKPLYQFTLQKTDDKISIDDMRTKLETAMSESFGDKVAIASVQSADPQLGGEFLATAIWMIAITMLIIMGYLAVRFEWVMGATAVGALAHDIIITMGIFLALGHTMTLDIVSALLIILGYAINDRIVVMDRIRELRNEHPGKSYYDITNMAINLTLSRTMLTGGSVMGILLVMYFFGGVGLKDFSLILLIGIIMGTFSSVYVAAKMAEILITRREKATGVVGIQKTKVVKMGA